MSDDDRRLGDRLRAYESRVPDAPTQPVTLSGRPRWSLVAAAGAAAVIAIAILVGTLANRDVGQADETASPTPTASSTVEPTLEPTPTATATVDPQPVPSQTPIPVDATPEPATGPIVRWAQVGAFASEGWAEEVTSMTYAAGHFIAVGYRERDDQRGYVGPPIDEPRIWISADGRTWELIDVGASFDSTSHPRWVVALPDGSAIAYGSVDPEPPASSRSAAWRSTDGRTWAPIELSVPRDDFLTRVVGGPRGLITVVSNFVAEDSGTAEVWHSTDGANWSVAHVIESRDGYLPSIVDWAAGPEGFVIAGHRYRFSADERDDRPIVLASGDGVAWFEAVAADTPPLLGQSIAPIGGDWMLIGERDEASSDPVAEAETWYSANGLTWEQRGSLSVPLPTNPDGYDIGTFVGHFVSTGERVIASGATSLCCHGAWWAAGVWSSHDARSWERLGFPDGTIVSAAAEHDGVVVLAGFDRARPEDAFRARAIFWIGERS